MNLEKTLKIILLGYIIIYFIFLIFSTDFSFPLVVVISPPPARKTGRTLFPTSLHLLRMEIMFQKWSKLVIRVTKDSICMNENHRFKA